MNEIAKSIIAEYLPILIETIITIIGGIAVSYLKKKIKSEETMRVVKSVVKATEQIHKDIHGHEKLYSAELRAKNILRSKGIDLSDFELTSLIESAVHDMNLELIGSKNDKGSGDS